MKRILIKTTLCTVFGFLTLPLSLGAADSGILNGGFESGDFTSWGGSGDARIVDSQGSVGPYQGTYMAMITTGAGAVDDSTSELETATFLTVPDAAKKVRVRWKFLSNEYPTYINPDTKYNDEFSIQIEMFGSSTRTVYSTTGIKSLTWKSSQSGYNGETDWQTALINLSSYAGKHIKLHFRVADVGDTLYDTAVLLDAIELANSQGQSLVQVDKPLIWVDGKDQWHEEDGHTVYDSQTVTCFMYCGTPKATIKYQKTYGSGDEYLLPNSKSPTYTKPFAEDSRVWLAAQASKSGMLSSDVTAALIDMRLPMLKPDQTITGISDKAKEWRYYGFMVPEGMQRLAIRLQPEVGATGDCDLYVRKFGPPTSSSSGYTAKSAQRGVVTENVQVSKPAAGIWWIGIYGTKDFTGWSLQAQHEQTYQDFYEASAYEDPAKNYNITISDLKRFEPVYDTEGVVQGYGAIIPIALLPKSGDVYNIRVNLPNDARWQGAGVYGIRFITREAKGTVYVTGKINQIEKAFGYNDVYMQADPILFLNRTKLKANSTLVNDPGLRAAEEGSRTLDLTIEVSKYTGTKAGQDEFLAQLVLLDPVAGPYVSGATAMARYAICLYYSSLILMLL